MDTEGGTFGRRDKLSDTKDSVGRAVESDRGRQSVDVESLAKKKMPTAETEDKKAPVARDTM